MKELFSSCEANHLAFGRPAPMEDSLFWWWDKCCLGGWHLLRAFLFPCLRSILCLLLSSTAQTCMGGSFPISTFSWFLFPHVCKAKSYLAFLQRQKRGRCRWHRCNALVEVTDTLLTYYSQSMSFMTAGQGAGLCAASQNKSEPSSGQGSFPPPSLASFTFLPPRPLMKHWQFLQAWEDS